MFELKISMSEIKEYTELLAHLLCTPTHDWKLVIFLVCVIFREKEHLDDKLQTVMKVFADFLTTIRCVQQ